MNMRSFKAFLKPRQVLFKRSLQKLTLGLETPSGNVVKIRSIQLITTGDNLLAIN